MITPRRSAAVLLAFFIFLGWFVLLRPTALGGSATFIMVSGDSMEPEYSHGDLVVLRKASSYEVGDIVAYPIGTTFDTGRLVIHRVIGQDGDGFITQGDNRETSDPWRATDENVRGAAWAHIPKLGIYMAWLQQPSHLGALAAGIVLMGGIGTAETERRRRHGMRQHLKGSNNRSGGGPAFGGYQPTVAAVAVAAGVLAAAFLVLAVLAFQSATQTSRQVSQPTYTETGTFGYTIQMEPSTLYPDGILRSPAAAEEGEQSETPVTGASGDGGEGAALPPSAFTALAREAQVTFEYELASAGAVDLSGTLAADLVIRPDDGAWTRTEALLAPTAFTGAATSTALTIDLVAVAGLIAQIEEETALTGGSYEVTVVARVEGEGTRAGEPVEVAFEQPFTLTYNRTLITPPAELSSSLQGSSSELVTSSKTLSLGVWSPSVSVARSVAVVGFSAALGAALVLGGYLALGLSTNEEARIRARYGSRMVDVEATDAGPADDSVHVASMRDLSRLAERFGSVILHQPLPGGHRYYVRDGEDTYEYVSVGNPAGAGSAGANVADTPGSQGGGG